MLPKKLVYLLKARLPTEKAHGYQSLKTCEALVKCGMDVEVWVPDRENSTELKDCGIREYYNLDVDIPIREVFVIDMLNKMDYLFSARLLKTKKWLSAQLITLMYMLGVARRALMESKETIFYTRDHNIASFLITIYPGLKRRLFVEVHTLSATEARKRRQAAILSRCAGVIAMTDTMKSELVRSGMSDDKVIVSHDAVDLNKFQLNMTIRQARNQLGLPNDRVLAMFVGKFHTLGNEKGIPEILAAIKLLQDDYPNLYCYCVGGPLDREPIYREMMARFGVPQDRVNFVEKRPINEVPLWLQAADILLMPHPYSEFYANYVSPLKLFEYMTSGRPIVASDLPSTKEILTHEVNALLGSAGDPRGIAENIRRLIADPDFAFALGQRAKENVQYHTWGSRARNVMNFIVLRHQFSKNN